MADTPAYSAGYLTLYLLHKQTCNWHSAESLKACSIDDQAQPYWCLDQRVVQPEAKYESTYMHWSVHNCIQVQISAPCLEHAKCLQHYTRKTEAAFVSVDKGTHFLRAAPTENDIKKWCLNTEAMSACTQ